jgi:ATP-dependent Lon protease
MRDFRDAKAMAQTLRGALKAKSVTLTNCESLELIAKIFGFHD